MLFQKKANVATVVAGGVQAPQVQSATDAARVKEGLPLDQDTPWILAQRHHDDRTLRSAVHTANWQRIAMFAMFVALVAVIGVGYIGAQSKVIPYLIEVDNLGRTIAVRAVDGRDATVDANRMIYREMVMLIENTRSVSLDFQQNNKALTLAFSRLTGAAYNYVRNDLSIKKPNEIAATKTVWVDVQLALPVTENTWQVEWLETSYNLGGEKMGPPERWKANIHYELRPGAKETDLRINPVGIYIHSITWTKLT